MTIPIYVTYASPAGTTGGNHGDELHVRRSRITKHRFKKICDLEERAVWGMTHLQVAPNQSRLDRSPSPTWERPPCWNTQAPQSLKLTYQRGNHQPGGFWHCMAHERVKCNALQGHGLHTKTKNPLIHWNSYGNPQSFMTLHDHSWPFMTIPSRDLKSPHNCGGSSSKNHASWSSMRFGGPCKPAMLSHCLLTTVVINQPFTGINVVIFAVVQLG